MLVIVGMVFGPRLYRLVFGGVNATWVSERFSEELIEKRELIVLEKTVYGAGECIHGRLADRTVQEVVIPYTFTASFSLICSWQASLMTKRIPPFRFRCPRLLSRITS